VMRVKKSSSKRHKCRAPVAFLNQPWRSAGVDFLGLLSGRFIIRL
jgi:hypothetical protein